MQRQLKFYLFQWLFVSLNLLVYVLNITVRGPKRAPADARLLQLWDHIPPGHG